MSLVFGTGDLRAFCTTGPRVAFNGVSTYSDGRPVQGLYDRPVEARLMDSGIGGVDAAYPEIRIPYNAFNPMPQNRDTIAVDGISYTILDTKTEDDGGLVCYMLKCL